MQPFETPAHESTRQHTLRSTPTSTLSVECLGRAGLVLPSEPMENDLHIQRQRYQLQTPFSLNRTLQDQSGEGSSNPTTQLGSSLNLDSLFPNIHINPAHPNVFPYVRNVSQQTGATSIEQTFTKRMAKLEGMVQRILGMPAPLKKSRLQSFADSPFVDDIALVEMLQRFTFPNMKLYDGTSDPDDHIATYKQRMFATAIPRDLREACMCKSFGSSLTGLALQWYIKISNNTITSFAELTDTFNE